MHENENAQKVANDAEKHETEVDACHDVVDAIVYVGLAFQIGGNRCHRVGHSSCCRRRRRLVRQIAHRRC